LTTTNVLRFRTFLSLRKGSRKIEDIRMDYSYLKILYDTYEQGSVWRISSDHGESSGINCLLHSWLPIITSDSYIPQKVESYVSSNSGITMTEVVGFYGLKATVDLMASLLTENLEIVGRLIRDQNLNWRRLGFSSIHK